MRTTTGTWNFGNGTHLVICVTSCVKVKILNVLLATTGQKCWPLSTVLPFVAKLSILHCMLMYNRNDVISELWNQLVPPKINSSQHCSHKVWLVQKRRHRRQDIRELFKKIDFTCRKHAVSMDIFLFATNYLRPEELCTVALMHMNDFKTDHRGQTSVLLRLIIICCHVLFP